MKYINSLKQSDFVVLLRSSMYDPESELVRKRLEQAYERFLVRINKLVRSRKSPVDKLRALTLVYETIDLIRIGISDRESSRYRYARSMCSVLRFEKEAILLQLKYPNMKESSGYNRKAPFRLSKKYTSTDLMEIITSLHALGFFCMPDGTPAALSKISREFGALCGVKIKNPDNSRWAILNRKIRLTHFLDILRNTLVDLSQK